MAQHQLIPPVAREADHDDDDEEIDLRLEIDDDEDFAIVKGDYASVIFQNLAEKYPVNAHIECKYTLTRSYQPNARDWIGLYKVGWSSPRDYKTYQWVVIPNDYKIHENNVAKVLFQAHVLPEDDGEFYQFCYVGGGQVRGASVPFQFKSPRGEDFVEIEGDEDLMIVRTKTAVLQENLDVANKKEKQLMDDKKKLESEKLILEAKIKELDSCMVDKNEQVNDAERLLEAREKELEELAALLHRAKESQEEQSIKVADLEKTVQTKQEKIEALKDAAVDRETESLRGKQEVTSLQRHKDETDRELSAAKTALKELQEELDKAQGLARGLQKEKELYKTHFNSTEETLRTAHGEHHALKHLISVKESEIKTLQERIVDLINSMEALKDAVDKEKRKSEQLDKKISATQECILHLQDKLANANDRAKAAEECKLMLDEQMKAYIAAYEGSAKDLVDARGLIHDLKDQVKRKDKLMSENAEATARLRTSLCEKEMEKEAAIAKINALEADRKILLEGKANAETELQKQEDAKVGKRVEVDGATGEASSNVPPVDDGSSSEAALHALKMVISHLEKRLEKKDKQMKKLTKSSVDLEHALTEKSRSESELKKQVEDLKRRLVMGAEEYKKKWIECKKLQKKIEKIKKDNCVSESDMEMSQLSISDSSEKDELLADMKLSMQQIKEKKNKFKQLYEAECVKNSQLRLEIQSLRSQLERAPVADEDERKSGGVIIKQPSPAASIPTKASVDKIRDSEAPSSPCLKPLPPPMIPVVLPSAKISAVSSFYDLPPSPKELEATLLASADERRGVKNEPPRGTADAETGISEEVASNDCNVEDKEEFFLAPEPSQHSPTSSQYTTVPKLVTPNGCVPEKATSVRHSKHESYEEPLTVCDECSFVFPRDASDVFIANHIQEHAGRLCPVCSKTFPSKTKDEQKAFENHVQSHFEDPGDETDEESGGRYEMTSFEMV